MSWDGKVLAAEFHAVPDPLVRVFGFLNTLDERAFGNHERTDEITNPASLARFLALPECTVAEHEFALRLRRALRAAATVNRTGITDSESARELDELSGRTLLCVRADGLGVGLTPAAGGVLGALAELLAAVVIATADGSWRRIKTCAAPDCGWVFYDRSKPRNARWCSTLGCGNRMKTRAYRRRGAAE